MKRTMMYLRLELKVCEGCGALWLRSQPKNTVYCKHCAVRLASFPARRKHAGGRPRGVRSTGHSPIRTAIGGAR